MHSSREKRKACVCVLVSVYYWKIIPILLMATMKYIAVAIRLQNNSMKVNKCIVMLAKYTSHTHIQFPYIEFHKIAFVSLLSSPLLCSISLPLLVCVLFVFFSSFFLLPFVTNCVFVSKCEWEYMLCDHDNLFYERKTFPMKWMVLKQKQHFRLFY